MDKKIMSIESEITSLKQILSSTDYKALKFAEGQISSEDYEKTRQQRQALRDRINELEGDLAKLETFPENFDINSEKI